MPTSQSAWNDRRVVFDKYNNLALLYGLVVIALKDDNVTSVQLSRHGLSGNYKSAVSELIGHQHYRTDHDNYHDDRQYFGHHSPEARGVAQRVSSPSFIQRIDEEIERNGEKHIE